MDPIRWLDMGACSNQEGLLYLGLLIVFKKLIHKYLEEWFDTNGPLFPLLLLKPHHYGFDIDGSTRPSYDNANFSTLQAIAACSVYKWVTIYGAE